MSNYPLLSVMGLEIELMLVNSETLNVAPRSDVIIKELAGEIVNEYSLGAISISNELVLHVLELKNNGPKPRHSPFAQDFQQAIKTLQPILAKHGLKLLPTGAHPWMIPELETKRWPHDNHEVYQQYDRIFNCQGHGWSNLQSMHINFPFANDEEFNRLHNAIRLLLPLLPALTASTPILDTNLGTHQCRRLVFYQTNQSSIPAISGKIIPEFVNSEQQYQDELLKPMYQAIAPYDPYKRLQYEWLNSRGAIAKFAYHAIEIRIIDTQESVNANVAIAQLIWAILNDWTSKPDYYLSNPAEGDLLSNLYQDTIRIGMASPINSTELLKQWQIEHTDLTNCQQVWQYLVDKYATHLDTPLQQALIHILNNGNLSQRIVKACHNQPISTSSLRPIYRQLEECLIMNKSYSP